MIVVASATLGAQWPKFTPYSSAGSRWQGRHDAPAPRGADGKPNFQASGKSLATRKDAPTPAPDEGAAPDGGGGSPFGNIGNSMPGGAAPYQPWAAELVKKRMADSSKDNPDAHCLPMGIAQLNAHLYPRKIMQTQTELALIYEASGTTVREVFIDGRPLPKAEDVEPWYNGYSVGRWDGDTLVVETTGFTDDQWLDVRGSPLTSAAKITERFRRPNFGTLELEETIDDPKAYTQPFTAKVYLPLQSRYAADRVRLHRQGRAALHRWECGKVIQSSGAKLPPLDRLERMHEHQDVQREVVANDRAPTVTSSTTTSATLTQTGSRRAIQKPSIIAPISDIELTMLSP